MSEKAIGYAELSLLFAFCRYNNGRLIKSAMVGRVGV